MTRPRPLLAAPSTGAASPPSRAPRVDAGATRAASDAELDAVAIVTGRAWAVSTVDDLRGRERAINGGWPGTLRQARGQMMVALSARPGLPVPTDRLDALARTAYASARHEWCTHAEPDLEA